MEFANGGKEKLELILKVSVPFNHTWLQPRAASAKRAQSNFPKDREV